MKAIYLGLSAIFTVLILILAFENISATCSGLNFLFFVVDENPTIITLGVAVLGILTGFCYHASISKIFTKSENEEDQQF